MKILIFDFHTILAELRPTKVRTQLKLSFLNKKNIIYIEPLFILSGDINGVYDSIYKQSLAVGWLLVSSLPSPGSISSWLGLNVLLHATAPVTDEFIPCYQCNIYMFIPS